MPTLETIIAGDHVQDTNAQATTRTAKPPPDTAEVAVGTYDICHVLVCGAMAVVVYSSVIELCIRLLCRHIDGNTYG